MNNMNANTNGSAIDHAIKDSKNAVQAIAAEAKPLAEKFQKTTKNMTRWTRDNPVPAMLIAGGVGVALGAMVRHSLARKH